ncbi:MAG: type IV secretion system DNA-binding domain-containing protein [Candidatus Pacebacteria bacterium]|nr:type IV secretion system DNA-binding domain-containing protein [Candidatus Paceibacterota bacterium]
MSEKITYFAETDFRNRKTRFGIKNKDRSRHVYIIGKTGMGKSTILENMAAQDIMNGEGMCFLDPHGSAIDVLIDYIPPERVNDVVYFAPFDTDYPMSFNVLEAVDRDRRHLVVAGLMASFKKIWPDSFSARMEYILANTLLALLEYPGATLLGVNRMLAEKDFRDDVIKHITDSSVKAFWIDEYNKWDPRYAREAGAAIQNKIGQFTSNPLIRNIVGQTRSSMDFREIMDDKKILLVNLSKGLIGESNGNLLGGMLITKLYLAAMSRADVGAGNLQKLPDFFFFVDEFQNFANESFADILSEARKYKLNLTVAHQYVEQMEEQVASAIFGNVGTMITFRIGATDAEVFEKQFAPTFTAEDIVNLGRFQIYLSLMIDGIGSRPFSARTLAPLPVQPVSMRNEMIRASRATYAQPRETVEAEIKTWFEPIKKPEKRSFNKDGKLTGSSSGQKGKEDKKPTKVFKVARDEANNPLKKVLKECDEKDAEVEMKQVVSPKLNDLLAKIDANPKSKVKEDAQSSASGVVKKIKDQDKRSEKADASDAQKTKTSIPKNISEKVLKVQQKTAVKKDETSTRGAKKATANSLQDALNKALGNSSKKTTQKDQKEKVIQGGKKETQNTQVKKDSSEKSKQTKKLKVSNDRTQESSKETSDVELNQSQKKQKEIPEDVLRNILA